MELEITVRRLLSIWWLMMWRGMVFGVLIGMAAGAVVGAVTGMVMAMTVHPLDVVAVQQMARITSLAVCIPLGAIWGVIVMRMALKKRYKDFRIVLVSLDSADAF